MNAGEIVQVMHFMMQCHAVAGKDGGVHMRSGNQEPYIHHPIRCANDAVDHDLPIICAAALLLHDVLEDCPDVKRNEAYIKLTWPAIYPIVDALTHRWGPHDRGPEYDQMKAAYYAHLVRVPWAIECKLIDRTDNLRDMFNTIKRDDRKGDRKWADNYLKKTRTEIDPLSAYCQTPSVYGAYEHVKLDMRLLLGMAD